MTIRTQSVTPPLQATHGPRSSRWALALLVALAASLGTSRATDRCGAICDETWDVAGSPWVATCDVTVTAGCTLTVDAGVEVRFQSAADLTVEGTLDVNGTSGSPVLFTSDALTPAPGDWDFIDFRVNGGGTVDFAVVEYASRGIYALNDSVVALNDVTVRFNDWGVWAASAATVTLNGVLAEQNFDGLRVNAATVTGTGNRFVNNSRYGVLVEAMNPLDSIALNDGEIHSNAFAGVYTTGGLDTERFLLDFRSNWWGTTDPSLIGAAIRDHTDSALLGVVDHCDYLDGPGGVPAVNAHCPDLTVCDGTSSLTQTDKPYLMSSDLVVCPTGTLEIGPGVTILVDPDPGLLEVYVNGGTVDVNGTSGSEATFTSRAGAPAPADWDGFEFRSGASALLDSAVVEYGDRGIYLLSGSTGTLNDVTVRLGTWNLWASQSPGLTLTNVTSEQATFDGFRAFQSTISGTGNQFVNNSRYGILIESMGALDSVALNDGEFHSNGSFNVYTSTGVDIERFLLDFRSNWWGTTDPLLIGAAIRDHTDSIGLPVVDRCDYLDGPGGLPVVNAHCPDLTVCDGISSLTLTDKPYLMTGDMLVCSTGTLEVGAGATLLVDPDPLLLEILVNSGTVDVNGTPGSEAAFTSRATVPAPGDWDGFELRGTTGGTFDSAIVEYADRGIYMIGSAVVTLNDVTVRHNTWGLWADTTPTLTMTNVTAEQSGFDGFRVRHATVSGTGNAFVNNSRNGLLVEAMSASDSISLHDGEIHSNGGSGMQASSGTDAARFFLDLRDNWWGTTNPSLIGAAISDHADNAGLPVADRCGYLDGPGGLPVVDAHCPDLTVCDGVATLSLTDKPYLMTGDMVVCPTGTLQALPGVTVLVDPDPSRLEIPVNGGIVDLAGVPGAEVSFSSRAAAPAPSDWDGFEAFAGATVGMDHAVIEHADRGLYLRDSSTADLQWTTFRLAVYGLWVSTTGTTASLRHVTSTQSSFDGLRADSGIVIDATGCVFTNNGRYGIYLQGLSGVPSLTLAASSLHSNLGGFDYYTDNLWTSPASTILRATDNWWGTNDDAMIRARILDFEDNAGRPHVYHRAFGDTCDIAVGVDGDGDGRGDFEDNCPAASNFTQIDTDADHMGNVCDPDPFNQPTGPCDGVNDPADGYVDTDGDGWGDVCDNQPVRADDYPGAPELCDGRDNDGDGSVGPDELTDDDSDDGMLCGDCDDSSPTVNVCVCETCTNIVDDDCNGLADGLDPLCIAAPNCLVIAAGPDPTLTIEPGPCAAGNGSGPFDVIRGELTQIAAVGGSIDLGNVACVVDNLALDRFTDTSPDPTDECGGTLVNFFLAQNDGAAAFGMSSLGEPRDVMNPNPACP